MLTRPAAKGAIFGARRLVSRLPLPTPVDRLLFIVSRTARERYEFLRNAFACDEQVEVIFDRRQGERRQHDATRAVERRRRQRRAHDVSREIARQGYAVVRRG
jgi:hypothetical protein